MIHGNSALFRDNPMVMLLDVLAPKAGSRPAAGAFAMAAVCGLAAALYAEMVDPDPLLTGLRVAAITLLLLFPCLQAYADAAQLASLRSGQILEEVLTTRTRTVELVDGVVLHSLREALAPALAVSAVLIPVELLRGDPGWCLFAVLWPGLFFLMTATSGYLLSSCAAGLPSTGAVEDERWNLLTLALAWIWLVGWMPLYLLGVALWLRFIRSCRSSAALALASEPQSQAAAEPRGTASSNPWIRPWNDNPIVIRECAREARRTSGGLLKFLGVRFGLGVLVAGFGLLLPGPPEPVLVILCLAMLQSLRAACLMVSSVVGEREKRTLEPLALSQLSAEEFVDGWCQLAWRPLLVEYGAATAALLCLGGLAPGSLMAAMAGAPLILACSYRGLVAGMERTRRAAFLSTGIFLMLLATLIGLGSLVTFGHAAIWLLLLGGLAIAMRSVALRLALERTRIA
ncbi:MAG: hypothetical protein HY319_08455 [Armatimonadetes bacterium]|nr:hypothetical protein [Armatimonadota bacterium]